MQKYLSTSLNSIVSIDYETAWAAKSLQETLRYDARFQQKQIQEREEKLLRMYENQQQRAYERIGGRNSAGSSTSLNGGSRGKVRQMFDERRQKAGVDRSYPLEPLKTTKSTTVNRNGSVDRNRTTVKTTQKTIKQQIRTTKTDDSRNNNQRDIVEMMNDHNLNDFNLDDEQMPNGFNDNIDDDDGDNDVNDNKFVGKLANVGGKLPSEKVVEEPPLLQQKKNRNDFGKTFRKDTKPVIKKTTKTTIRPASGTMQRTKVIPSPTNQKPTASSRTASAAPSVASTASKRPQLRQPSDSLRQCRYCNRRFAVDRIPTHENICVKTLKKKRKVYDATKHRIEGTELEQFVVKKPSKIRYKPQQQQPVQVPKKDWRVTHEEFINTIRAAKQAHEYVAKGGKLSDLPPPPPSSNPDYVQCPHCNRRFNQNAAERHIPKCATYEFNKTKPKAGSTRGGRY